MFLFLLLTYNSASVLVCKHKNRITVDFFYMRNFQTGLFAAIPHLLSIDSLAPKGIGHFYFRTSQIPYKFPTEPYNLRTYCGQSVCNYCNPLFIYTS